MKNLFKNKGSFQKNALNIILAVFLVFSFIPIVQVSAYLPVGCTSTNDFAEYSTVTGLSCASGIIYPEGCASSYGFSTITGQSCRHVTIASYSYLSGISGCTSDNGYSPLTGESCLTGRSNYPLSGTAGSLDEVNRLPSPQNKYISENVSNSWFAGYAITPDKGSDLAITSVKISLEMTGGDASRKLERYAKTISIWQEGTKVASVDVASFSKNKNIYTKTINLSGVVLGSDQESDFFLGVETLKNIDTANVNNTWAVTLKEIRYRDASGANITDNKTGAIGEDGKVNLHFVPVPREMDF